MQLQEESKQTRRAGNKLKAQYHQDKVRFYIVLLNDFQWLTKQATSTIQKHMMSNDEKEQEELTKIKNKKLMHILQIKERVWEAKA